MSLIYRGYFINQNDAGKYDVIKDGKTVATADREQAALDYVDIEKRRERDAKKATA
jgi:hypothetical protein